MSAKVVPLEPPTKVLLCGGGNAIHVLTSYVSSLEDADVSILSLFPGEAQRLRDSIPEQGVRCINDLGEDRYGKPVMISDNPQEVAPGAGTILHLCLWHCYPII